MPTHTSHSFLQYTDLKHPQSAFNLRNRVSRRTDSIFAPEHTGKMDHGHMDHGDMPMDQCSMNAGSLAPEPDPG
jgi:hypothetical protein